MVAPKARTDWTGLTLVDGRCFAVTEGGDELDVRGLQSSDLRRLTALAKKARSGEELTDEDVAKIRGIVCRYGKQLAAFAREADLAANPELAKVAKMFSALPKPVVTEISEDDIVEE